MRPGISTEAVIMLWSASELSSWIAASSELGIEDWPSVWQMLMRNQLD